MNVDDEDESVAEETDHEDDHDIDYQMLKTSSKRFWEKISQLEEKYVNTEDSYDYVVDPTNFRCYPTQNKLKEIIKSVPNTSLNKVTDNLSDNNNINEITRENLELSSSTEIDEDDFSSDGEFNEIEEFDGSSDGSLIENVGNVESDGEFHGNVVSDGKFHSNDVCDWNLNQICNETRVKPCQVLLTRLDSFNICNSIRTDWLERDYSTKKLELLQNIKETVVCGKDSITGIESGLENTAMNVSNKVVSDINGEIIVGTMPKPVVNNVETSPKFGPNNVETSPKLGPNNVESSPKPVVNNVETSPKFGPNNVETSPNLGPNNVETSPKLGPNNVETSPKLGPNNVETSPKLGPNNVGTSPNLGPNNVETSPNLGPNNVETSPKLGPNNVETSPKFGPNNVETSPKPVVNNVETSPKFGPNNVETSPNLGPNNVETSPKLGPNNVETSPKSVVNNVKTTSKPVANNVKTMTAPGANAETSTAPGANVEITPKLVANALITPKHGANNVEITPKRVANNVETSPKLGTNNVNTMTEPGANVEITPKRVANVKITPKLSFDEINFKPKRINCFENFTRKCLSSNPEFTRNSEDSKVESTPEAILIDTSSNIEAKLVETASNLKDSNVYSKPNCDKKQTREGTSNNINQLSTTDNCEYNSYEYLITLSPDRSSHEHKLSMIKNINPNKHVENDSNYESPCKKTKLDQGLAIKNSKYVKTKENLTTSKTVTDELSHNYQNLKTNAISKGKTDTERNLKSKTKFQSTPNPLKSNFKDLNDEINSRKHESINHKQSNSTDQQLSSIRNDSQFSNTNEESSSSDSFDWRNPPRSFYSNSKSTESSRTLTSNNSNKRKRYSFVGYEQDLSSHKYSVKIKQSSTIKM